MAMSSISVYAGGSSSIQIRCPRWLRFLCVVWLFACGLPTVDASDAAPWWGSHWRMRLRLTVDVGLYERFDTSVEQFLNFKTFLAGIDRSGETVIPESFRLLEVDADGGVIDESAPFQFEALTPDSGYLVLLLTGATAAHAQRHYHLYFDTRGDFAPAEIDPLVEVIDNVPDEGLDCYMIATANATYYYQKDAGGFSSLLDVEGNDWIGFHPFGGSDGIYRGIPNMVHPDNIFHPGHRNCVSSIDHVGPLRTTIHSVSNDGLWECIWHIYPRYARMTLLRCAPKPYWFLYEGTPGGAIDYDLDFSVRSDGVRLPAGREWQNQDIPAPEWVYFEDSTLDRYIYLVHEEDDAHNDTYWPMEQNMTVFGFGRGPGTSKHMAATPTHFTIGLADDAQFASASSVIEASYRPVAVTIDSVIEQPGLEALEAHWKCDEGQGTVAEDSSKYGRHAFLTGVSWNTSGKANGALRFDGTGGYAQAVGYTGVLGTRARTLSLWMSTSVEGDMDLVSWGMNQPDALWALSIMQGGGRGQPKGALLLDLGESSMVGQTTLTDGQWHHIAVVLPERESPRIQDIRMYVDGHVESSTTSLDVPVNTLAGSDVRFGKRTGDTWAPLEGMLDEVRIDRRAMTPEEIAELADVLQ